MILPQCVLFDLDGTLLDSLPGIESSVRAAFLACGREMPPVDLGAEIGPPMRTILRRITGEVDEAKLDQLERAFRHDYDTDGWKRTPCYPGAVEVLRAMRDGGHRLFVVSNKPAHIAPLILEREGVLPLFEQVFTREGRIPHYSGKAEMMAVLMAEHGLAARECIMVGDTSEDGEAAMAHGIPFVLMTHGYGDVPLAGQVPVVARLAGFNDFLPLRVGEG